MRAHADLETLAAFREELLPRRRARRVAAHLAHCTQCAGLDARLADVPGLLASAPAPPMPDALAARIEAAIAAEAAGRAVTSVPGTGGTELAAAADGPAGAGTAPPAGVTPAPDVADGATRGHRRRPPARDRSRLALRIAAAAAAVVVVGGGGYGVSRLFSSPAPPATASRATGSVPGVAPQEHGPRHLGTALSGGAGARNGASSPNPAEPGIMASGTNYLPGRLRAQVEAALTEVNRPAATPSPFSPLASSRIARCVARVTGGKRRPLLVDHARFEGKPATVIVVPAGRPNLARVVVVGPACSATVTDQLASTTLPR